MRDDLRNKLVGENHTARLTQFFKAFDDSVEIWTKMSVPGATRP